MNYDDLITAAKDYADRHDIEVERNLDTFIRMAEARINRLLKVRKQTHRIFTNTFDGVDRYTLPDDYAGMRAIKYIDNASQSTSNLDYITPNEFNRVDDDAYNAPMFYTIEANQIRVYPIKGNGQLEILFYRKVGALNKVNSVNWLADDHPDIYLSGIIAEIETFVKNHDIAKVWYDKMTIAINELSDSDYNERWAGNILTVRAE